MSILNQLFLFKKSFNEQQKIIKDVWTIADNMLSIDGQHSQFNVTLNPLSKEFLNFNNNIFSSLFLSIFYIFDIPQERIRLYGSINHLFRAWVTSADNLLDNERKITFDIAMPGDSNVMKQVVVLMLADRIMNRLLAEAVQREIISSADSILLSDKTLQILLASAAEEGMEEGGVENYPKPEFIISDIHPIKTGVLFHIPFMALETIEKEIDKPKLEELKKGLMLFGIGCQLLDDIRDLNRDFIEKRVNYCISSLFYNNQLDEINPFINRNDIDANIAIYLKELLRPTYELACNKLDCAINILDKNGFTGMRHIKQKIVNEIINKLDLKEIKNEFK
jgi:hypothetical protein